MFASSVVAIPMLLDRPVSVLTAVSTSVTAALASPAAMALWATLILVISLLGMATLMLGLVGVITINGSHALNLAGLVLAWCACRSAPMDAVQRLSLIHI